MDLRAEFYGCDARVLKVEIGCQASFALCFGFINYMSSLKIKLGAKDLVSVPLIIRYFPRRKRVHDTELMENEFYSWF